MGKIDFTVSKYVKMKKKLLYVVPHLSTGGMPQYTLSLLKRMIGTYDVYCIEYNYLSPTFIVQRTQVSELLGDNFIPRNNGDLRLIVDNINPDIVHLQEIPELFMSTEDANWLYSNERRYTIVETSHDSSFDVSNKRYLPDRFGLISEFQRLNFSRLGIPIDIVESDIEYKERPDRDTTLFNKLGLDPRFKHVLNVGLWTSRKNQAEILEYARKLEHKPIQFHFVGNMADNFQSYWKPLIETLPSNVKIWGERSDVDLFYSCMDLFLFTSRGNENDKETSPLVIREAIGSGMPLLIYDLPVYMGMYHKYKSVNYLSDSFAENIDKICELSGLNGEKEKGIHTRNGIIDFSSLTYTGGMIDAIDRYGDAGGMYWGTYIHKELDRNFLTLDKCDVFLDLGANIGISSLYAKENGAKRIYTVEPDPKLIPILSENVPSAKVKNVAVGKTKEEIELYHWPYNDVNKGPKYKTQTLSLKEIIDWTEENIIDYLKIDIEGFEETVFDSLPKSYFYRIRQMFIEHHDESTYRSLVHKLEKFGFDIDVEIGVGQVYLYCRQKSLYSYKSKSFAIRYEKETNKIEYLCKDNSVKNFVISIRDIDSRAVIWSSKYDVLPSNSWFWIIPLPVEYYNFNTNTDFGGFLIEFYEDDKLVDDRQIRIRHPKINKPAIQILNKTEPVFINYNEFFVERIYDKYLYGKKFDTILDVGANVGLWTEYIKTLNPNARVFDIEPNKVALEVLNASYDRSIDNVETLGVALSSKDGTLTLYSDANNSTISSIENYGRPFGNQYSVDSISFNTLINRLKLTTIDLMKVDIESAEYDLFDSMSDLQIKTINNLLVEYHIFGEITFENKVQPLIDRFTSIGYDVSVERLYDTGGYIFASKNSTTIRKKIKVVHLLLSDVDLPQQQLSIENVSKICGLLGIEYIQFFNKEYVDTPPKSTCNRPNANLSPAHYGCFSSFRDAILSELTPDIDYLMIFEGDAKIVDVGKFVDAINSIPIDTNLKYISLGGRYDLDNGYLQSNDILPTKPLDNFIYADKIIGCQCILLPFDKNIKEILRQEPWDAFDVFMNEVMAKYQFNRIVSKETIVTQYNGMSVIDKTYKKFKEFDI